MTSAGRSSTLLALVLAAALVCPTSPLVAQQAGVAGVAAKSALTAEQIEAFLLTAKIVKSREIGKGITGSKVATLSDGQITHDAHIQNVNVEMQVFQSRTGPTEFNFKDQYRYNIAAYRLSRLLGLSNVPVSVERRIDRGPAAVTWWVDDVMMDELGRYKLEKKKEIPKGWRQARTAGYIHVMRVFDELIANTDRNAGNQLWSSDGTLWLIDHTRAFRLHHTLKKGRGLERCDRDLYKALRSLTMESVTAAVDRTLTKDEIKAILARRDLLVKQFDDMIKTRGDNAILYTLIR